MIRPSVEHPVFLHNPNHHSPGTDRTDRTPEIPSTQMTALAVPTVLTGLVQRWRRASTRKDDAAAALSARASLQPEQQRSHVF